MIQVGQHALTSVRRTVLELLRRHNQNVPGVSINRVFFDEVDVVQRHCFRLPGHRQRFDFSECFAQAHQFYHVLKYQ